MRVVIIDYGVGNLANVAYAWQRLGVDPIITNAPRLIRQADLIELPGVGAMRDAMENLRKRDLIPVLEEEVKRVLSFSACASACRRFLKRLMKTAFTRRWDFAG